MRLWILAICLSLSPVASGLEVFAKGTASKSNISAEKYTISVSATTGFAFSIFGNIRFEFRYTNQSSLQNRLDIVTTTAVGTINDFKTQTDIFSGGLSINLLGPKSSIQPFVYVGAGYIETERSYFFTLAGDSNFTFTKEPKQKGISANLGVGFRVRAARSLALEVEAFAYGLDVDKPEPLVNLYGTVGIRLFF